LVLADKSIALTQTARRDISAMKYVNKFIVRMRENQTGQTMTEYVLIIAAIAVAG
jgi:hypothetical protein